MSGFWDDGQLYERFIGRWSRLIARVFIDWLAPPASLRWLDLGCGTGALSETVLARGRPASVLAVDPSQAFIAYAQRQIADPRIAFFVGDALHLPAGAQSIDLAVSGLALNFIPEPTAALRAIRHTLQPEGAIALYVWDYAGKMEMLRYFWDSAAALDPRAQALDEGPRFPLCQPGPLRQAFEEAGLRHIKVEALEITQSFAGFEDYWSPFLGGQGPAPGYVVSLEGSRRRALEAHLRSHLPFGEDGSLRLVARAWAVRGVV